MLHFPDFLVLLSRIASSQGFNSGLQSAHEKYVQFNSAHRGTWWKRSSDQAPQKKNITPYSCVPRGHFNCSSTKTSPPHCKIGWQRGPSAVQGAVCFQGCWSQDLSVPTSKAPAVQHCLPWVSPTWKECCELRAAIHSETFIAGTLQKCCLQTARCIMFSTCNSRAWRGCTSQTSSLKHPVTCLINHPRIPKNLRILLATIPNLHPTRNFPDTPKGHGQGAWSHQMWAGQQHNCDWPMAHPNHWHWYPAQAQTTSQGPSVTYGWSFHKLQNIFTP